MMPRLGFGGAGIMFGGSKATSGRDVTVTRRHHRHECFLQFIRTYTSLMANVEHVVGLTAFFAIASPNPVVLFEVQCWPAL